MKKLLYLPMLVPLLLWSCYRLLQLGEVTLSLMNEDDYKNYILNEFEQVPKSVVYFFGALLWITFILWILW